MREELARREGLRGLFTATYARPGSRTSRGYEVLTLLLVDVKDASGQTVTDHLWFTRTLRWQRLNLQPGNQVRFTARVAPYQKGYIDRVTDWKLSHPSNIAVLGRPAEPAMNQPELFPTKNAEPPCGDSAFP